MTLRPSTCPSCSALYDAEQRYCLGCGALVAPRRVDPLLALGFPPEEALGGEPTTVPAAPAAVPAGSSAAGPARRRPSPRVAVAMAAGALVLGGVAGAALGPTPEDSLAAAPARQVVALVVPEATTTAAAEAPAARQPATPRHSAATPAAAPSADDDATAAADATPAATKTTDSTDSTADDDTDTTSDDDSTSSSAPESTTVPAGTTPAHVWLVALPAGTDPTILTPLAAQGATLSGYTGAGPSAAVNGVALLGGQVPTADCTADATPCVLPAGETSLPDQLTAINLTWKAYVADAALRCAAPSALVPTSLFTTLRDRPDCATTTVGTDALAADLKDSDRTPALSLIVPRDPATELAPLVAQITASDAYKKDGVLVIVPDAPPPGALVLSPRVTAGATDATATGPVALLRSLDGLFGLDPLATAADATAGALDPVLPAATSTTPTSSTPSTTTTSTTRRSP
ncbi:hypothetical protein [Conexibacter woesei]|uniref:hypothetical protein n=1 Tax=Conexibacter woesei TaxID=191495 RepID=UPI00040E7E37|nr:hypothetical protein [Conexibacter woesei]